MKFPNTSNKLSILGKNVVIYTFQNRPYMNRSRILAVLLIIFTGAQAQDVTDSLWNVWNDTEQADTSRIMAMHQLVGMTLYADADSAYQLGLMEYELAERAAELGWQGKSQAMLGACMQFTGNFEQALVHYHIWKDKAEEDDDMVMVAMAYNNIGTVHWRLGTLAQAIDYLFESLWVREELGDSSGIATCYNNIALIYEEQGDLEHSREYMEMSLEINRQLGDDKSVTMTLSNLGLNAMKTGNLDMAESYFNSALELALELDQRSSIGSTYNSLGLVNLARADHATAESYFLQSLEVKEAIGDARAISSSLHNLGKVMIATGRYNEAVGQCQRALDLAIESSALKEQVGACECLYKANRSLSDYRRALEYHEQFMSLKDSMLNKDSLLLVSKREFQYNYDKQAELDSVAHVQEIALQEANHQTLMAEEETRRYALYGGLGLLLIVGGMLYRGNVMKRRANRIITDQKLQVEEKNREILDSITYAKRIQSAILPPDRVVKEYLEDSFILYKPKDIVAGDFYWLEALDGKILFAAADCTGHGVPGAMVSVVCNNGLNRSVREHGLTDPGEILNRTREIVKEEFDKSDDNVKDGMDIALCCLEGNTLKYAGANNPLWIIRNGELLEIKADKLPVSTYVFVEKYTTHTIELQPGDTIYLFSDGYADQFGGERGKKMKARAFKEKLLSIQGLSMSDQRRTIDEAFEAWRGDLEQVDDVCVIGVRV